MSTIISTVLIASPPAFLAGWILCKVLLRQNSRPPTQVTAVGDRLSSADSSASGSSPAREVGQPVKPATHVAAQLSGEALQEPPAGERQLINKLRQQAAAAEAGLPPLQAEVQLLKEAAAEREQLLRDLKQKLQLQQKTAPPEDSPAVAAATETARYRHLLQAMKDRLGTHEQRITELTDELELAQKKRQRTARRFLKWRDKIKPLAKQFRQQRAIIKELREELRQREQRQREQETRHAKERARHIAAARQAAAKMTGESVTAEQVAEPAQPHRARQTVDGAADKRTLDDKHAADTLANASQTLAADAADEPDYGDDEREDLQSLRGIGPALHARLNEKGVYRLRQLALMDQRELLRLGNSLGIGKKAILNQDWSGQARGLLHMSARSHRDSSGSDQSAVELADNLQTTRTE